MTMTRIALLISAVAFTSACDPSPPREECVQYVDCQAHFEDINGTDATDLSETYGEGGTCWQYADTADSCTTACTNAVSSLKDSLEAAGEELGACG